MRAAIKKEVKWAAMWAAWQLWQCSKKKKNKVHEMHLVETEYKCKLASRAYKMRICMCVSLSLWAGQKGDDEQSHVFWRQVSGSEWSCPALNFMHNFNFM